MPVRRRLMHKSPRPAFRPRIYPQHGPLLGRGYVIRFFLLTDSAWYVGAAPLPRLLQGFATLRLAIRLRATIDSSYPPFTHGQAPLSTDPSWLTASPLPPAPRRRPCPQSRAGTADRRAWRARYSGRVPGRASAGRRRTP